MYTFPPSKSLSAYSSQNAFQAATMSPSFEYYFSDMVAGVDYHLLPDHAGKAGTFYTAAVSRADGRYPRLARPHNNGDEDDEATMSIFTRGGDQNHTSFWNHQPRQQGREDNHWPLTAPTVQEDTYISTGGCQNLSHSIPTRQAVAGDDGSLNGTNTAPVYDSSVGILSNSSYYVPKVDAEWSACYPMPGVTSPPADKSICEGDHGRLSDCDQAIGSERLLNNTRHGSQHTKLKCFDHGCNGRTFSCQANLLRHRKEQSAEAKTFHCRRCGRPFTRATARNLHEKRRTCDKMSVGSQS